MHNKSFLLEEIILEITLSNNQYQIICIVQCVRIVNKYNL